MRLLSLIGDDYQWYDGQTGGVAPLATLREMAGQRFSVVIPGQSVLLIEAMAPRRNRGAWRNALPYALEDQLATDVERLHFALGPTAADGTTSVAVVDTEVLHQHLDPLQAAGLNVQAVIPDTLLLPLPEAGWSLLHSPDSAQTLVRTGRYSGFACEPALLPPLLTLALEQATTPPAQLQIWGQPPPLADTAVSTVILPAPAERLALLYPGVASATALNLLQGAFSPSAHFYRWLRPWRTAAVLSGLLLAASVVQTSVNYWQLQRQRDELQSMIEQTFRQAVPDVQRIVNPRVQLAHRLQQVTGSTATDGEFLRLLVYTSDILREFPELSLQALRFRAGRLEFDLHGGSLEQLEQLQQRLRSSAGYQAQLQASVREDQVISRLTVMAGSS